MSRAASRVPGFMVFVVRATGARRTLSAIAVSGACAAAMALVASCGQDDGSSENGGANRPAPEGSPAPGAPVPSNGTPSNGTPSNGTSGNGTPVPGGTVAPGLGTPSPTPGASPTPGGGIIAPPIGDAALAGLVGGERWQAMGALARRVRGPTSGQERLEITFYPSRVDASHCARPPEGAFVRMFALPRVGTHDVVTTGELATVGEGRTTRAWALSLTSLAGGRLAGKTSAAVDERNTVSGSFVGIDCDAPPALTAEERCLARVGWTWSESACVEAFPRHGALGAFAGRYVLDSVVAVEGGTLRSLEVDIVATPMRESLSASSAGRLDIRAAATIDERTLPEDEPQAYGYLFSLAGSRTGDDDRLERVDPFSGESATVAQIVPTRPNGIGPEATERPTLRANDGTKSRCISATAPGPFEFEFIPVSKDAGEVVFTAGRWYFSEADGADVCVLRKFRALVRRVP
jgi:hypothetical protein